MFLIVGLGNPGPKYAGHRHNVGFVVVDELASRAGAPAFRDKHGGRVTRGSLGAEPVVLLQPQTFMNRSGESVQKAMRFFDVALERVLVVHDELDLDFGVVRVKAGGGLAGHNGLRSIAQHGGGQGFLRVRVGIGRPPGARSTHSWVLSDFAAEERAELPGVVTRAADAAADVLRVGVEAAMNEHNRRG